MDCQNQTTGLEHNNASGVGNAEEQEPAKEPGGVLVMMVVMEHHYQSNLLDSSQIIEKHYIGHYI